MNKWPKKFTIENLTIDNMIELLTYNYTKLYNQFIYGVETLAESYIDKKDNECFEKVLEIKDIFIRKQSGINIYQNGLNMNTINVQSLHLNLSTKCL